MVALPARPPRHPWKLVGPWYRWPRPAVPEDGRFAPPAIQKFAGAGFIPGFLADPQRSLAHDPGIDTVSTVDLLPAVSGGNLAGKLAALFATQADGTPVKPTDATPEILKNLKRARLVPSGLRKLYQPAHDRHYLVVCELHCDLPGFPTVPRGEVCQSGFVIRRRQRVVPPALTEAAAARAAALARAEAGLAELRQATPLRHDLAAQRQAEIAAMAEAGTLAPAIAAGEAAIATLRTELHGWFAANGITTRIEAWAPGADPALGAWVPLADEAADPAAGEQVHPLYPLIAPAGAAGHDAAGRTMLYGLVPTASLQQDAAGRPRFDDQSTYEIRCFVRRHDPCCPPGTGRVPDCRGEVVWSAPTAPYRVAAPFDPLGSANRAVSIKMPDLRELAAQIAARPRGSLSPVRIVQPQHLSPLTKEGAVTGGRMSGNAVCFFSIPLITIVALFVLNLFLPIVVFLFQLWFLLLFRFCIPPQVKFGAGLDAALAATPPSVDLDADFKVSLDGVSMASATELHAALRGNLGDKIAQEGMENPAAELDRFSNNALGNLHRTMADNAAIGEAGAADPEAAATPGARGPDALVWEPRREPAWRLLEGRG